MNEGSLTTVPGANAHVTHQELPSTSPLDMTQLLREAEAAARKASTHPSRITRNE